MPTRPVFKSLLCGAAMAGPKEADALALFASWPLIVFGISTLAIYVPLLAALATVAAGRRQ